MKKIIAFGGSISSNSINKQFATFTAHKIDNVEVEVLDLNDYEMPFFSADFEKTNGIPQQASNFIEKISQADGLVISLAEYNGSFSAAYKNIYDWVSRIESNVFQNKPIFLLSTSPGRRGGKSVLNHAASLYSYSNKAELITFSLPSFYKNFNNEDGILDEDLSHEFEEKLSTFKSTIQVD